MMSSSSSDTTPSLPHDAEARAEIDFETLLQGTPSEVCSRLREFLCSPAFERPLAPSMAEYRRQVLEWCHALARAGFGKLGLPEDMGGDPLGFFLLCESLALFDLSLMVKFGVHAGLVQGTLARLGTERHRSWLALTQNFERIGCFAMTETAHGSDVRGIETVVRYEANSQEFVVDTPHRGARKDYIGSALDGHFAVVFAQLESAGARHGIHAFLVPLRDEDGSLRAGVQIEDCGPKAGLNGVDNGRISFFGVRIPRENLLNRFSDVDEEGHYQTVIPNEGARFFSMLSNLLAGRLMVCAATWSGARAALTIAIRYGLRRRQFGEPESLLLDYPSHQQRLMPRVAQAYATKMALDGVRDEYLQALAEERPVGRSLETRIAALKAYCSWTALETVQTCRECCGGAGYLAENRIGVVRADLDVFTTFEGDNTVLGLLVARNLLAEAQGNSPSSLVTTAAGRLMPGRWSKPRSALTRANSVAAVRTAEFQGGAFRSRRERLAASLTQRIERRVGQGKTVGEAFHLCQDHALALAWAYASECVFDAFDALVSQREVFAPLRDLFALWTLQSEAAFFLEKDMFTGSQMPILRRAVSELCSELRDGAEELVNYFDIPDRLLGAPNLLEP